HLPFSVISVSSVVNRTWILRMNVILTINGGSSSIKFAVFDTQPKPRRIISGQIERVGYPQSQLTLTRAGAQSQPLPQPTDSMNTASDGILDALRREFGEIDIRGIGHRIVTGGSVLTEHQPLTEKILAELRRIRPLDLPHLPREIALIEAFSRF